VGVPQWLEGPAEFKKDGEQAKQVTSARPFSSGMCQFESTGSWRDLEHAERRRNQGHAEKHLHAVSRRVVPPVQVVYHQSACVGARIAGEAGGGHSGYHRGTGEAGSPSPDEEAPWHRSA
jgi:hypothetical protein